MKKLRKSVYRNAEWSINDRGDGATTTEEARLAVLMDIRTELQTLNRYIRRRNCLDIPNILRRIEKNTKKRKYRRKRK